MNRLVRETSPYLRDHAHQPVDWYPWGEEAWARARNEDKPLFLSIGYSSCHWCHVMARESFEDEETARILNESFVPVKVDREEQPEVDEVYIEAVRILNSSAGWPLSVFLTPDLKPFYGGSYFPKEPRHGLPAFKRVLLSVAAHYRQYRSEIDLAGQTIAEKLAELSSLPCHDGELDSTPLRTFHDQRLEVFDSEHGGFGIAPKFPGPTDLVLLLRLARQRGPAGPLYPQALAMADLTLRKMAQGGIFDHLGGGFHRYSTDTLWLVPHFEKMLYDNALLAQAYIEAFELSGDDFFASVARDTLGFLEREMMLPDGAFAAALDADSGESEGSYYVWTHAEVERAVGAELAPLALDLYGVADAGSFHGHNVLHLGAPVDRLLACHDLTPDRLWPRVEDINRHLRAARGRRRAPRRDDKVLGGWNGLALSAFAAAYRAFGEQRFLDTATRLARRLESGLMRGPDVLHLAREGQDDLPGSLADYAFVSQGLLDLYEAGFRLADLHRATAVAERMVELFGDPEGGFYSARPGTPMLIIRAKNGYDGALPSGNSVAVCVLLRLARLAGRADLERTAVAALRRFYPLAAEHPAAFSVMLTALDFLLHPGTELALLLPDDGPESRALLEWVRRNPDPYRTTAVLRPGERAGGGPLPPLLEDREPVSGRATAFLCRGTTCLEPVHTPGELDRLCRLPEPGPA